MSKTKEDIMVDFEEILRKAVARSVEIDISKNTNERMRLINDTFSLALLEYVRGLSMSTGNRNAMLSENDRIAMIMAYGSHELGIFSFDLLAESLAKILR